MQQNTQCPGTQVALHFDQARCLCSMAMHRKVGDQRITYVLQPRNDSQGSTLTVTQVADGTVALDTSQAWLQTPSARQLVAQYGRDNNLARLLASLLLS
jgi:hypothetical protein